MRTSIRVPKFLVKNFADLDGRVFCLNIHTDQVTKPPPKQAASEKGFNVFQVAGEAVSFEDRLEKLERKPHRSSSASSTSGNLGLSVPSIAGG